ncbi:hypothetical protein KEJ47_09430 [Candidatus Bathyarchaeota archaeon]|nr:hypothetical protein [Candidatus Bathyarchaeota archaeon]
MKIPELKSQYVWLVVLLVYVTAVIVPIGAPFQMSEITVKIYNKINELQEGDIVVIGGAYVFAFDLESSAALIPCLRQLAQKKVRIVNAPFAVEAVQFEKYAMDASRITDKMGGTYKYGVDWVQLPYMPGWPAALVGFLEDVHSAVATDVYGTPIDQIPLMKDLRSYKDIKLFIVPHWSFDMVVRYATAERGIPAIYFAQAAAYASYSPFMMAYPDKVFMTNGFLGGAQYEKLMGMTGLGHSAIDAYAILSAVFLGFVILGNLTMLSRIGKEEEK